MKLVEGFAILVVHVVFQMSEERFDWCVVDAVAASGHRLNHVQSFDLLDIERVGIVETLVGMDQGILEYGWREYRIVL